MSKCLTQPDRCPTCITHRVRDVFIGQEGPALFAASGFQEPIVWWKGLKNKLKIKTNIHCKLNLKKV